MRKGERSWFRISHQYAYGEEGSFSFPSVPPCADLDYEVELLDYETLDEEEASPGSMIFEERLKAAEVRGGGAVSWWPSVSLLRVNNLDS